MVANCQDEELHAAALGNSRAGTRLGSRATEAGNSNARAVPNTTRTPNSNAVVLPPRSVKARNSRAHAASTTMHTAITLRRS